MQRNRSTVSAGGIVVLFVVLLNAIVIRQGFVIHPEWYRFLFLTLPLLTFLVFRRKML